MCLNRPLAFFSRKKECLQGLESLPGEEMWHLSVQGKTQRLTTDIGEKVGLHIWGRGAVKVRGWGKEEHSRLVVWRPGLRSPLRFSFFH